MFECLRREHFLIYSRILQVLIELPRLTNTMPTSQTAHTFKISVNDI